MVQKVNIDTVIGYELVIERTGEKLSTAKSLSDMFDLTKVLVHQEVLHPGRRASSFHFHSEKEEMFYVLAGRPSLLVGDQIADLEPGDFIGFAPSEKTPHMLFNRSAEPATVLTIGTHSSTDEITYLEQEVFHHLAIGQN